MVEEAIIAYLAGLFDGEGSVSILKQYKGKHKTGGAGSWRAVRLVITNRNRDCLELAEKHFSGLIYRQEPQNKDWSPAYRWQAHGRFAVEFLEAIRPYVVIKKPHIDAVLNNLDDKARASELLRTFNKRGKLKGTQLPLN